MDVTSTFGCCAVAATRGTKSVIDGFLGEVEDLAFGWGTRRSGMAACTFASKHVNEIHALAHALSLCSARLR